MPTKKTAKPNTPCKTCFNRERDEPHQCHYCGLTGKDIGSIATEEFEDEKAYCINHRKRALDGPQMPG